MTTPLLVTIDVEGGDQPDPYRTVDALAEFLTDSGLPATLFVTPDVVTARPETVAGWLEGGHAVGLHVHPARFGADSDRLTDFDADAIEGFVAEGIETFADQLDHRPESFRAGRWAYSDALLAALERQGIYRDASLRPDRHREQYRANGVAEYPLSVYANPLVRLALSPWSVNAIALHADSFLSSRVLAAGFYAVTHGVLRAERSYAMVAFHDYDVVQGQVRDRITRYLDWLAARAEPRTIDEMALPADE